MGSMTVDIGYDYVCHDCTSDDVMKSQAKYPRQWLE